MQDTSVTATAHVIQQSLSPIFLLLGIGTMLNVITSRLGRIVDRAAERATPTVQRESLKSRAFAASGANSAYFDRNGPGRALRVAGPAPSTGPHRRENSPATSRGGVWCNSVDIDTIQRLGGVAQHCNPNAPSNIPNIGASQSRMVTTSDITCVPASGSKTAGVATTGGTPGTGESSRRGGVSGTCHPGSADDWRAGKAPAPSGRETVKPANDTKPLTLLGLLGLGVLGAMRRRR
jgi:MYXO-CTERM domain-containing protein